MRKAYNGGVMVSPAIRQKLLERLDQLPLPQQRRVLDFADALVQTKPRGVPGKELAKHIGLFDEQSLREMQEAIEEHCERIDPDKW